MKKTLLFLVSMVVGVTTFAQSFTAEWPKTVVPEFKQVAVEDTLYLWNVGVGGFYINYQGPGDWPTYGTHASVNDSVGTTVILTRTNPNKDVSEDWGDIPNAYLLVSYVTKHKGYYCSFANDPVDTDGRIYTDNNTNQNRYWDIVPDGNYFKIVGDEEGNTNAPGLSLGAKSTQYGWLVFHSGTTQTGDFYDQWAAVSKDAYEAWRVARGGEEGEKIVECYNASEKLKAEILIAQEKGYTAASLADYYAVYNNLNSTAEELTVARTALWEMWRWEEIKDVFNESNITVGERNNVSEVFNNNNFDEGNTNGWDLNYVIGADVQNLGYQQGGDAGYTNTYEGEDGQDITCTIFKFIEAWRDAKNPLGNGSITQSIPNMPKGKYVLAVDVNARNQSNENDVDNVQLFAQASGTGADYYTPVSTPKDFPRHFEFTFIHTGGSMTMGVRTVNRASAKNPANWIAMDNLELYYYGDEGITPEQLALQQLVEELMGKQDPEKIDGVVANAAKKVAYTTAFATANGILENGGDYAQASTDLQAAYDALVASVADYKVFASFLEQAEQRMLDFEGTPYERSVGEPLAEEVGKWYDAYDDGEYDKKEIEDLDSILVKVVADHFPAELTANDDLTPFIANANFNRGFFGWSSVDATPAWGGTIMEKDEAGGVTYKTSNKVEGCEPIESGCAEVFQKTFSMFQTYKGLPAGVYQLRAQMFERDDDKKGVASYLYAKVGDEEQKQAAPLIEEYPTDEKLFILLNDEGSEVWGTDIETAEGNGAYIPKNMEGANYHFSHTTEGNELPDYTVTLNIVLNEKSDVEFGVKNTSGGDWVIFDNFQLIYLGEDLSVYLIPVNAKLKELRTYVGENEDNVGADVKDNLDALNAGVANLKTKDDCVAYIATIEDAIAYAKKSASLYAQADELCNQLSVAIDGTDANQVAAEQAATYIGTFSDDLSNRELTVAELEAIVEQIPIWRTAVQLPDDFDTASDENGVDVTKLIVNPDFEKELTGWTNSGTIAAWTQNNKSFDNYQGELYCECYHKNGTIDVNQTIAALPAGTYELSVAIYSQATDCKLYANDCIADIPANASARYTVTFKLETLSDVKLGVSWTDKGGFWNALDDFQLTYYGTASEKTPTEVEGIADGTAVKANGKFFANGRIVIMKNGVKYNVAGQMVK